MLSPHSRPDDEAIAANLKPVDILYFFDEPVIFTAKSRLFPLLCSKTDEEGETVQFFVVPTSDRTINDLKSGRISAIKAFSQPWCWIVETSRSFDVKRSWGLPLEEIPREFLPEPGIGLYPYHGHIADEFEIGREPFLSMRFAGGRLRNRENIDFGTFLQLAYGVYASVRKAIAPAFSDFQNRGITDNAIARMLSIPMREPALGSLKIEIEKPSLNPNVMRRPPQIDWDDSQRRIEAAVISFIEGTERVNRAAYRNELTENLLDLNFTAIDAISAIVPSESSDYETVEITGVAAQGKIKKITIGPEAGTNIRSAHWRHLNEPSTFTGTIVELSIRSGTFILKRLTGREITCELPNRDVRDEAFAAFQEGLRIKVKGRLHNRKRRDYLTVDEITLPDGKVIKRGNG